MSLLDRARAADKGEQAKMLVEAGQRRAAERAEAVQSLREERDSWYRCPSCPYKTKQRRGLPQVAHNCPVKKALTELKEDRP